MRAQPIEYDLGAAQFNLLATPRNMINANAQQCVWPPVIVKPTTESESPA
jgi:hypothetical protein